MRALRNIPIKHKLIAISMLTTAAALLLASFAFVGYELAGFRASLVEDAATTAAMVAENSSAALTFEDPVSAEQTLKSLAAHAHITGAALYDVSGALFSRYERAGASGAFTPPPPRSEGYRFEDGHLKLFREIRLAGERAGTVYIESDLEEMRTRVRQYAMIALAVMLAASFAAYLIARKLQVAISGPLLQLTEVMGTVAARKDYSVRAAAQGRDELGRLIEGFNGMLSQIQAQDSALQEAREGLERRVEERTNELRKEIAEHKQAQIALENLHRELLSASRRAGMAEIATNVLHNVGNVLNSVNVSASQMADNLQRSKAASLGKVVGLLGEHAHELAAFVTEDPKGRQLPGYLAQLSQHLIAEQQAMAAELESLRSNVDHIKEIVAMQQSYAKISGVNEIIAVAALVEDSLRMNTGALARHGIELVREFQPVSAVNVDKHKVLQILVNLVRNAKYACSESARPDKKIIVRIEQGEGCVRIKVIDNGVGIERSDMARIFNHGYTTRESGHGFGLHSGALAAKELGGALNVHSEGPGKGATFTLEIPAHAVEPVQSLEGAHA